MLRRHEHLVLTLPRLPRSTGYVTSNALCPPALTHHHLKGGARHKKNALCTKLPKTSSSVLVATRPPGLKSSSVFFGLSWSVWLVAHAHRLLSQSLSFRAPLSSLSLSVNQVSICRACCTGFSPPPPQTDLISHLGHLLFFIANLTLSSAPTLLVLHRNFLLSVQHLRFELAVPTLVA